MPGSWPYLREPIKKYLVETYSKESTILDIGVGEGTFYDLLNDHFSVFDGVEIWEPYIEKYELENKYRKIYNMNIMDFTFDWYDVIIIGDTLEHLSREDGTKLIPYLYDRCKEIIVVVPFLLPQTEVFGNKYEAHLQEDLYFDIMEKFYPQLQLMTVEGFTGYEGSDRLALPIDVGENRYWQCAYRKKYEN